MKTNITKIASVLASIIWADGEYDEDEKVAVSEIADAFELDEDEFSAAIDTEINAIVKLDEEAATEYLINAADEVAADEVELIYEAAMQLAISDNELTEGEVAILLAIADAMGLEQETAVLLLADMVKTEPDLEISFE